MRKSADNTWKENGRFVKIKEHIFENLDQGSQFTCPNIESTELHEKMVLVPVRVKSNDRAESVAVQGSSHQARVCGQPCR